MCFGYFTELSYSLYQVACHWQYMGACDGEKWPSEPGGIPVKEKQNDLLKMI